MHEHKNISIYYDSSKKLIGVPCGRKKGLQFGDCGTTSLDIYFELESGYDDDEFEIFLGKVFDACFTKIPTSEDTTAIQKYTGKKGYAAATRGFQYVYISWSKGEGYTFIPMKIDPKHKGAFVGIKGISIVVTPYSNHIPLEKGALALAFRKAMEVIDEINLS